MSEQEPRRLLVVEDEEHLATGLKLNLELEGFAVDVANDARQAVAKLLDPAAYDAIVLDVMLPDIDGFELCRRLRDSGNFVPVIMLTARDSAQDRVLGLEAGADDYMVKPFKLAELLARVRSMLRRRDWDHGQAHRVKHVLEFGKARVDFDTHEVEIDGKALLRYFAQNPGRVLSRKELLEKVWKLRNYDNTRTVDNFIMRLRRRFEVDDAEPRHFVSVRGAGYKFEPNG
jgi:DNA-binding response OmpR family regulator